MQPLTLFYQPCSPPRAKQTPARRGYLAGPGDAAADQISDVVVLVSLEVHGGAGLFLQVGLLSQGPAVQQSRFAAFRSHGEVGAGLYRARVESSGTCLSPSCRIWASGGLLGLGLDVLGLRRGQEVYLSFLVESVPISLGTPIQEGVCGQSGTLIVAKVSSGWPDPLVLDIFQTFPDLAHMP